MTGDNVVCLRVAIVAVETDAVVWLPSAFPVGVDDCCAESPEVREELLGAHGHDADVALGDHDDLREVRVGSDERLRADVELMLAALNDPTDDVFPQMIKIIVCVDSTMPRCVYTKLSNPNKKI